MKGTMSMYDYRGKIWGLIISAIALLAMIGERLKGFIIFKKLTVAQHYGIFEWIMLAGLFCIIYSKEKHEDERAKQIRSKSFQMSFALTMSVLLAQALIGTLHPNYVIEPQILFFIAAFGIMMYLFIFHIGLHFDFLWEYDDKGVWENLRNIDKNIWGKLVYLIAGGVILLLLSLL